LSLNFIAMGKEKKGKLEQFASDLAVGGIAGAVAKTLMAPIERVKILMQTQDSNPKILSGEEKRYSGLGDCFKRVRAEQGFNAFWRGNLVNCLRYAPQQGSALAFNDTIRTLTPKYDPIQEVYKATATSLMSGGLAGAAANTICYPFDFARTRLASDVGSGKKMFNGIGDCIMKTLKSQGIMGLYRGWAVTCGGAFVYRGGQLGLFSQIMAMNPYKDDKGPFGLVMTFIAATAGRTAVMPFNYPFDTVRRRLMLESEKPAEARLYSGGVDCFFKVMKAEGFGGMYKGMVPELFRGVGGSLVLVAYNRIKVYLGI
jgi:solute carrier family 25 (adenine nucleotide translocator) protein 4/5/6/31